MTTFNLKSWLLLTLLILSSCTTPYQPMGFLGGVDSKPMAKGVFFIRAQGNGYTSYTAIQEYLLLKSAETTIEAGAKYFVFMDKTDTSGTTSYMDFNTGQIHYTYRPSAGSFIRVFKTKPANSELVFDANDVILTIKDRVVGK